MKLLILENNLREHLGHFLNCTMGLAREARFSGFYSGVQVFCHKKAQENIIKLTAAKPTFRHVSWQRHWRLEAYQSMRKYGEIFAEDCRDHVIPKADDILMVPTAHENQVYGVAAFLQGLPESTRPVVVLNFHSDGLVETDERTEASRSAFSFLSAVATKTVLVTAPTPEIVAVLNTVTGDTPARLFPLPQDYGRRSATNSAGSRARAPTIAVLGRPIRRKGSADVATIIRRVAAAAPEAKFIVQSTLRSPSTLALASLRNVKLKLGGLKPEDYRSTVNASDILLMPYQAAAYTKRTSGIFAECAAAGKVSVAPEDTWMARQITDEYAAGNIYASGTTDAIVDATVGAIQDIDKLTRQAISRAQYWREHQSAQAYIESLILATTNTPEASNDSHVVQSKQVIHL